MRSIFFIALPAALLLGACTQQDMCISRSTRDLRVVNSLVSETQRNIDRGYALEEYTDIEYDYEQCGVDANKRPIMCRVPNEITRTRPVAIDLNAEASKLQSLLTKQRQLSAQASTSIENCKLQYPES